MCLFPKNNTRYDSIAYKKGLREFECGHCPECLGKRANKWALRAIYQARESVNCCMVTLTYDSFMRDSSGKILTDKNGIPLENRASRNVDKRDCQLFIKRLREYFHRKKNVDNIKYLLSAEYGKPKPNVPNGRPHYHAILFGVKFEDLLFHKKSKRGNTIYRSKTLEKLWKNGICTVDSVNVSAGIVKYCTKYSLKDCGVDDTFTLCSHNIGINELLKDFNGKSYWIDGNEYPIPREVWQKYIEKKYESFYNPAKPYRVFTYKYKAMPKQTKTYKYRFQFDCEDFAFIEDGWYIRTRYKTNNNLLPNRYTYHLFPQEVKPKKYRKEFQVYTENQVARARYRNIRDNDIVYKSYVKYWKDKTKQKEFLRGNQVERILLLDNKKYWFYKNACLTFLREKRLLGNTKLPPRCEKKYIPLQRTPYECWLYRHLPVPSRHIRANDRKKEKIIVFDGEVITTSLKNVPLYKLKYVQTSLFD